MPLPTQADEDWRYVDCAPLAAAPAGEAPCWGQAGGALPPAADATHTWAGAVVRQAALAGQHRLRDTGGDWALVLTVAPGASAHLVVERAAVVGRSASWVHIELGRGASLVLDDITPQRTGTALAAISASVAQDAQLAVAVAQAGGDLQRHRIDITLLAPGAGFSLATASAARGRDQAHVLTRVTHRSGATTSRQVAKAVLHDRARGSFDGLVIMPPGSAGAAAEQVTRHLLLSPEARADARPQLDIRVDDVTASHGATIGQLDADELLYLRARGLPVAAATRLLTEAFLDEALLAIRDDAARTAAREHLHAV
jgi:Fe-S cluster assembly scaffold protein SufB